MSKAEPLPAFARQQLYTRDRITLTPAQRRRCKRKDNRAEGNVWGGGKGHPTPRRADARRFRVEGRRFLERRRA